MNIFVYSDESGVFDKIHNEYFVFGGLIFLSKEERDIASRKYSKAEHDIKRKYQNNQEIKACYITNSEKGKLYRSLNNYYKFGVIIKQSDVYNEIFQHKKIKQRFLDYTYKIAVKRCLKRMIDEELINPNEVENMYFFVDEHTTATNGKYELKEGLFEEFKVGTPCFKYNIIYPPIFPELKSLTVNFCDSKHKVLIRAADIVANNIYYHATKLNQLSYHEKNLNVILQPSKNVNKKYIN